MTPSSLYLGKVTHQRYRPRQHRLEYQVYSLLIDLEKLPDIAKRLRLFSHNGLSLFSIHDSDYGPGDNSELKGYIEKQLSFGGLQDVDGPIYLLCYPRFLGYVFNPLSVYYCYRKDGRLGALLYEVTNTHGEHHSYLIPVSSQDRIIKQSCDKKFFVSPFLPMDCVYHFSIKPPGEKISVVIQETHKGAPILDAWFSGDRRELTDANLLKTAFKIPFLTLKVVLGIHWEALKLWWKRIPIFPHSPAPKQSVSLITRDSQ